MAVVLPRASLSDVRRNALLAATAHMGFVASALILPLVLLRLLFQLNGMRFPDEPLFQSFTPLMSDMLWGKAWILQLFGAFVAALAFFLARRERFRGLGIWIAAAVSLLIATTFALSGHAAAVPSPRELSIAADALHVTGAGVWIGTLLLVFRFVLVPAGVDVSSSLEKLHVVQAFSPIALACAAVVVASGVFAASLHIESGNDVFGTQYGRTVLIKFACACVVLLFGYINWKRNTPLITSDDGAAIMRGARRELIAAIIVLLVTSALVVTAPPGP